MFLGAAQVDEVVFSIFSDVFLVVSLLIATKQLYMMVCPLVRPSVGNQLFLSFLPIRIDFCCVYVLVSFVLGRYWSLSLAL